jgi:hypothetical protein
MLDRDLAEFYRVETRALKQAVKHNIKRFSEDFIFELSEEEVNILVSQNVIPSKSYLDSAVPYALTETGIAMLSGVLKSKQAVDINIAIMRTFIILRKMLYRPTLHVELKKGTDAPFFYLYNKIIIYRNLPLGKDYLYNMDLSFHSRIQNKLQSLSSHASQVLF